MLQLYPWTEIEGMFTIKNQHGEDVGTFRDETREHYNSVLTLYSDATHTVNGKRLMEVGNFINAQFGEEKEFAVLISTVIQH